MSEAKLHTASDRDVIVSVQDGNYRMVEVVRVTGPANSGPISVITVTFHATTSRLPASVHVEFSPAIAEGGQQ